jgi:hypothetical protein
MEKGKWSESSTILLNRILEGHISNWAQLEIQAMLVGFSITDDFVDSVFRMVSRKNAYDFVHDSLGAFRKLDEMLERNPRLLNVLLRHEGVSVLEYDETGPVPSEEDEDRRFSVVKLFYEADIRNPRILLTIFLKRNVSEFMKIETKYLNGLIDLFNFTIVRTRMRARNSYRFMEFHERLEKKYREFSSAISFMK